MLDFNDKCKENFFDLTLSPRKNLFKSKAAFHLNFFTLIVVLLFMIVYRVKLATRLVGFLQLYHNLNFLQENPGNSRSYFIDPICLVLRDPEFIIIISGPIVLRQTIIGSEIIHLISHHRSSLTVHRIIWSSTVPRLRRLSSWFVCYKLMYDEKE